MSDEPYSFGPTDSREGSTPDGRLRPELPTGSEPSNTAGNAGFPSSAAPSGSAPHDAAPYRTAAYGTAGYGSAPYDGPPRDHGAAPDATAPAGERPAAGSAEPAPWGAKAAVEGRKRMSTVAKSLTAVGVAALIAVGGTVAVTSANADNAPSSASSGMQPMGEGGGFTDGTGTGTGTTGTGTSRSGGFGGGMASRSLVGGALHGEFVVAAGTGTRTERLQTGAVTAVSSVSLTVKSTDDFTATYTLPSGSDVSALTTGTAVTVIATVDGSTLTVVSITATQTGTGSSGAGGFTPPDGAVPGGDGPSSSSTGTSTGTGTGRTGTAPGGSTTGSTGDDSGV